MYGHGLYSYLWPIYSYASRVLSRCIVAAYIVMHYIAIAYIVVAHTVMAR